MNESREIEWGKIAHRQIFIELQCREQIEDRSRVLLSQASLPEHMLK